MGKNIICNAFTLQEGGSACAQMAGESGEELEDIYMQNCFVSLCSAKRCNPQDDVMLLATRPVPEKYRMLFEKNQIQVQVIPFDSFVMPDDFAWAPAFFKLCALRYLTEHTGYDRILLLDADTITMHGYEELWEEAEHGVLLYGVGHTMRHHDRALIRDDYRKLYPDGREHIIHYGGELVGGTRWELQRFVTLCGQVYQAMQESGFAVSHRAGDETILSIAAAHAQRVIDAAPYLYRFWTQSFYLVSTVTVYNPVAVWHLPDEKKTGFVRMFSYYRWHGKFPKPKRAARMFGIVRARRPASFFMLRYRLRRKWNALRRGKKTKTGGAG